MEGPYAVLNSTPIADASSGDFQYVDASVESGLTWFYRILGVEENGEVEAFGPYEITLQSLVPAHLTLHPARPNPFNPNTKLSFDLPRTGAVFVRVYAVNGRLVRTLVAGEQLQAGTQEITWNGRDNEQRPVASGIYIVRLDAQGRTATQRAVLIR